MKNLVLFYTLGFLLINADIKAQSWAWAKKDAGTGSTYANKIAADASGNAIVAGEGYIAKYNSSGSQLWKKTSSTGFTGHATGVCTDGTGNIYVAGTYSTAITFGSTTLTGAGNSDMFLVKFDPGGSTVWAISIGDVGIDEGGAVSISPSGDIYATGSFNSPNLTLGSSSITSAGTSAFIAKLNPSGTFIWARALANGAYTGIKSAAIDNSGNVLIAGIFSNSNLTIGATTLTTSDFYPHVFVAEYDASGGVMWAKGAASSYYDGAYSITADGSGNSYVVGSFTGNTITFGSVMLTNASTGSMDAFAVSYDAAGNVRWAKRAGGTGTDEILGAAADNAGNLYIAGGFSGSSFDFGTISIANSAASSFDIIVAKYNSSGVEQWATKVGGSDDESAHAIVVNSDGSAYINGIYNSTSVSFDASTLAFSGGVNKDFFIAKLAANNAVPQLDQDPGFSVYPNPAKEEIVVSPAMQVTDVSIMDVAGRVVLTKEGGQKELHIDIHSLPEGVYQVKANQAKANQGEVRRFAKE